MLGVYGTPFWGRLGGRRGSAMAPLERAMVVSYRLSIVTVVHICNHSAGICDRMSPTFKSTGVGHFGPKFRGVPLGANPSRWGCKERTSQVN